MSHQQIEIRHEVPAASRGTDRRYGAGGETSYQGVKGKVAGRKPADQRLLHSKDRFSTSRRKGEGAPKPDRASRRARGRQDRFAPEVGLAASLDWRCARRSIDFAGRDGEAGAQAEQRNLTLATRGFGRFQ